MSLTTLTSTIKARIAAMIQVKEPEIENLIKTDSLPSEIKGILANLDKRSFVSNFIANIDLDKVSEVLSKFIVRLVDGLVEEEYREAVLARAAERMPLDAIPAINPFQSDDLPEILILTALARFDKPTPMPSNVSIDEVELALGKSKDKQALKVSRLMKSNHLPKLPKTAAKLPDMGAKFSEMLLSSIDQIFKVPVPHFLPDNSTFNPISKSYQQFLDKGLSEINNVFSEINKLLPDPRSQSLYEPLFSWPLLPCMIIISLDKDVKRELKESMIAIDAGVPHHEVVAGWTKEAKKPEAKRTQKRRLYFAKDNPGKIELLAPGKSVQIRVPFDGQSLTESFVETIRNWRDWFGLRNWAALQRLLSDKGMRTGRVRWLLSEHLDALGYSERSREDPEVREKIAREVELFTQLEIAIYNPDGTLRLREPILSPTRKYDALRDGKWALEGMELQIAQSLYEGIRNFETDKLGSNWFPAPAELPQIDHARYPHAIALGLILPMRWRWAWGENKEYVPLSGQKLLELANIPQSPENPSRAWDTLKLNLDELEKIGCIGRIEWKGEPFTNAAIARIYPSHKLLDRTHRGLRAIEAKKPDLPVTGAEFVEWRKGKGWTQTEAAKQLNVSERTLRRAETLPEQTLKPAIRKALTQLLMTGQNSIPTGQKTADPAEKPAKKPQRVAEDLE